MNPVTSYLNEVRGELQKVIWPKREEVIRLTATVIIIAAIIGVYLGGLDYLFTKALEIVLTK